MTSLQGKRAAFALAVAACAVAVAGAATLSDVLSQRPVIAPEVTQGEPAKPAGFPLPELKKAGCWEVTLADSELSARWVSECGDLPPAKLGAHPWRPGVLRLPAAADLAPPEAHIVNHAALSGDLAQRGEGALLFLPSAASGAGYYVAAWSVLRESDDEDDAAEPLVPRHARGYQLGQYGTAPVSVSTPSGRVYLQPDFAPGHVLAHNAAQELEPTEPEASAAASDADSASEPTP